MKKNVKTLLALLLFGTIASAQGIDFGLKGGYLYSDMNVNNTQELKSKAKGGYLFGAFARLSGKKLYLQPELQYRVRTSDFELKDVVGEIEVNYKTLDVPVQVGVNLLDLSLVKIGLHAGPVASFKLSNDTSLKDVATDVKENSKEYIDRYIKDYKSFVWSGQVGVTVDVLKFVIDLSYEKGFVNLAEKGAGKNDLFMATVGIKIF